MAGHGLDDGNSISAKGKSIYLRQHHQTHSVAHPVSYSIGTAGKVNKGSVGDQSSLLRSEFHTAQNVVTCFLYAFTVWWLSTGAIYVADGVRCLQQLALIQLVKKFLVLTEPDGLWPCSHKPTFYSILSQFSPFHNLTTCYLTSILILSSELCLRFLSHLFLWCFPAKACVNFLFSYMFLPPYHSLN